MEIPVALVGEIHLEGILTVARMTGRSPVTVLRRTLDVGLHGGEPMLSPAELRSLREILDEFPAIALELGLEDEAPVSGEIGGSRPAS